VEGRLADLEQWVHVFNVSAMRHGSRHSTDFNRDGGMMDGRLPKHQRNGDTIARHPERRGKRYRAVIARHIDGRAASDRGGRVARPSVGQSGTMAHVARNEGRVHERAQWLLTHSLLINGWRT